MGENGFEAFITKDGRFVPVSHPTLFSDIDSGGKVFNSMQLKSLEILWNLSNIKFNSLNLPTKGNANLPNVDKSIHINGLTVTRQGNEDWVDGLERYIYTHKGSL